MDFSSLDALGDISSCEKIPSLEVSISDIVASHIDAISNRLFNGRSNSTKGKRILHDTVLPPPEEKQPLIPLAPVEVCQQNAVQMTKETDQFGLSGLSFALDSSNEPNELEDISTESDGELEDSKKDKVHVTSNFIDVFKGIDMISSSNDSDALSSKQFKADGGGNSTRDLLDNACLGKSCSCSFCLKAAHMWMDLTFQDTRGRLSELRKSKKRASDQVARITQDFSKISKYAKLEVDLMQRWKMLFLHTQDKLANEIVQTQSDLEARSKLMENCKRDLELRSNSVLLPDK